MMNMASHHWFVYRLGSSAQKIKCLVYKEDIKHKSSYNKKEETKKV